MVFYSWPSKKEKKLFTRETSQQEEEEREVFLGFVLISTTKGMESKLAKSYSYFFVFLKVFLTHKKKTKKRNETSMDSTMKKYEHRLLE